MPDFIKILTKVRVFCFAYTIIIISVLFVKCEEEKAEHRSYPSLRTHQVTSISENGATFNGEIISAGTEEIKEFGFVWRIGYDPLYDNSEKIIFSSGINTGVFSADIITTLVEGKTYRVKAFAKTDQHIVYGPAVEFISLGSGAPVITGFSPDTVRWCDTLIIKGQNFSYVPSINIVRLNQSGCTIIKSNDSLLFVAINPQLTDIKSRISVEIAGNKTIYEDKELILKLPVISMYSPQTGRWGDTIMITGKELVTNVNSFSVTFNNVSAEILQKRTDTLYVKVPYDLAEENNEVEVQINSLILALPQLFILKLPVISKISPQTAAWGDTVMITGYKLMTDVSRIFVTFNNLSSEIVSKKEDTLLITVPYDLTTLNSDVKVKINNVTLALPLPFALSPPVIKDFSPKEGTWKTIVCFHGKFHPVRSRNKIMIGGFQQEIVFNSKDSIKIRINDFVESHDNQVMLVSSPFNIAVPDHFILYGPLIESVTPMSGISGTDITITGKYLAKYRGDPFTTVYFGSEPAWMGSVSGTEITCKVPGGIPNGPTKVTVKVHAQSSVFQQDFTTANAIITDFYPVTGVSGDEITIVGENFGAGTQVYLQVFFEDFNNHYKLTDAEIISKTDNKMIVLVPAGLDSVPKLISVSRGSWSRLDKQFVLSPPEITSISSPVLVPGSDIIVSGKNFSSVSGENQVFWGANSLPVKSSTPTEIIASVPVYMSRGINKIGVATAGYKRFFPDLFEVKSKWKRVTLPVDLIVRTYNDINETGIAFSAGSTGFFMDFTGQMTSYDPGTGSFTPLGEYNIFSYVRGLTGTVCNDTIYYGGGNYGFNRYDLSTRSWVRIANMPSGSRYGVTLAVNGEFFHGLNNEKMFYPFNNDNKFWNFYKPFKTWSSINNFPGFTSTYVVAYFSIGSKGYVLFADNTFCEYDPAADYWRLLAPYPGGGTGHYGMVSFVISNKAYVGLGKDNNNSSDEFWIFDPVSGTWSEGPHMPWGPRHNSIAFTVGDKAYVGFGSINSVSQNDLYEYDPDFIW